MTFSSVCFCKIIAACLFYGHISLKMLCNSSLVFNQSLIDQSLSNLNTHEVMDTVRNV